MSCTKHILTKPNATNAAKPAVEYGKPDLTKSCFALVPFAYSAPVKVALNPACRQQCNRGALARQATHDAGHSNLDDSDSVNFNPTKQPPIRGGDEVALLSRLRSLAASHNHHGVAGSPNRYEDAKLCRLHATGIVQFH